MANQEKRKSFFGNLMVETERKITNPADYEPDQLKSLLAAQMIAGGREIILIGKGAKGFLISEKTLHGALCLPVNKLRIFLKVVTDKMYESEEVILRKAPPFSLN